MGSVTLPDRALERVFAAAAAYDSLDDFTLKHVRRALADGPDCWQCTDAEWKLARGEIKLAWTALLEAYEAAVALAEEQEPADSDESEEEYAPRTKYDRAAEKNVKVLMGAFGDFLGGLVEPGAGEADDDDDDCEEEEEAADDASSASTRAHAAPKQAAAAKKRKRVVASDSAESDGNGPDEGKGEEKKKNSVAKKPRKTTIATGSASRSSNRKSAKVVSDSDDNSEIPTGSPVALTSKVKAKAAAAPASTTMLMRDSDLSEVEDNGPLLPGARKRTAKAKGKGRAKETGGGDEKKPKGKKTTGKGEKGSVKATGGKKERKIPEPKPGDAPRGTDAEEARIKKLKELLTAAASPRPFTASTGAERTLSVSKRTEILEGLLDGLGLAVQAGKLPTLSKAKAIGEKRALAKEMAELGGVVHHTGLRTGKELHGAESSEDDDNDGAAGGGGGGPSASAQKKQVLAARKKFGAFLGDQSDSESD
ncbi:hypothetical protein JCM3774_003851 [Rhodotorula dairenensis]